MVMVGVECSRVMAGSRNKASGHGPSSPHRSSADGHPLTLLASPQTRLFAMARPPPLVFLPDVPLREILAYLLLDTPRAPNRAAVVRTCKALHRLGLPLLYRVLDLGRYPTDVKFAGAWTVLFGAQGVLTQGGSMPNLAAMVVELRIGGCGRVDDWTGSDALQGQPDPPVLGSA